MSHAPEPWDIRPYVDAIDIVDANGIIVAHMADRTIDLVGMPPDNARRIMAAVNALAGLTPEQVAAIPRLIKWYRGKPSDFPRDDQWKAEWREVERIFDPKDES